MATTCRYVLVASIMRPRSRRLVDQLSGFVGVCVKKGTVFGAARLTEKRLLAFWVGSRYGNSL